MPPAATIVVPTYARPALVREAVDSALAQTVADHEVVVVDDASPEPVTLPHHPRLRVVRMARNGGGAAARNVGLGEARGRYITYVDDDDRLLPAHLEVALEALSATDLPTPVASLSGTVVVVGDEVRETRLPPTFARGAHFGLEPLPPGRHFGTKATLVVEADVLRSVGAWDEAFRSRVHTELFLRLNPVCSILGLPTVTYEHRSHSGDRVTADPVRRERSMLQLRDKHRAAFSAHPRAHAAMVFEQAMHMWLGGHRPAALACGRGRCGHTRGRRGVVPHARCVSEWTMPGRDARRPSRRWPGRPDRWSPRARLLLSP